MENKISIRVTSRREDKWYRYGQVFQVLNYVSFAWEGGNPHFEQENGRYGIDCNDCEILPLDYKEECGCCKEFEDLKHEITAWEVKYENIKQVVNR